MTLEEFIKNAIEQSKLDIKDVDKAKAYIINKARQHATGNCAIVSDETVYDWLINNVDAINKYKAGASVPATPVQKPEVKPVVEQPKEEPVKQAKPKKKKGDDECEIQLSLFDL